jgi:hypothetical protein
MSKTAKIGDNNPPTLEQTLREKHKAIFDRLKAWKRKAEKADLNPKTVADCNALDALFGEGRDLANDADTVRTKEKEEPLEMGRKIDGVFNVGVRDEVGVKGGLAERIKQAAADRRLALTREDQRKAQEVADKLAADAQKAADAAAAQEAKGNTRMADVKNNQADVIQGQAEQQAAFAAAPESTASKARFGGVTSSVQGVRVCTSVDRDNLDLNAIRAFIKGDALVDAVNAKLKMDKDAVVTGAVIIERAKSSVR